ncbi:wrky transcription factor 35 [Hordeum vulgare]|nr:wrky transcription factor 35 [Hordeum vulgare]
MGGGSSSSSSSCSLGTTPPLATVKAKPRETLEPHRRRGGNLVINKGLRQPLPSRDHLRLAKPKKEKESTMLSVAVKQEHVEMAADLDISLKWSCDDYTREKMERQRRAVEEIAAQCRGHKKGGIIILDDSNEEMPEQTARIDSCDPGQGCSKDGAEDGGEKDTDGDGDDDGNNYTAFY